jgi:hypothetical protein
MSDVMVAVPELVRPLGSPAAQTAGQQEGGAGQAAGGTGPAGHGPQAGILPGSRRLGPRRCAELAGVIVLALLPMAVVAAFIAVLFFGQLGSGAAGGCGGG